MTCGVTPSVACGAVYNSTLISRTSLALTCSLLACLVRLSVSTCQVRFLWNLIQLHLEHSCSQHFSKYTTNLLLAQWTTRPRCCYFAIWRLVALKVTWPALDPISNMTQHDEFFLCATFYIFGNCYVMFSLIRVFYLFGKTFRERKIISVIIISSCAICACAVL